MKFSKKMLHEEVKRNFALYIRKIHEQAIFKFQISCLFSNFSYCNFLLPSFSSINENQIYSTELNVFFFSFFQVCAELRQQQTTFADIEIAAKLPALKQLLLDCGIGQPQQQLSCLKNAPIIDVQPGAPQQQLVSQHRALIFCQLKAMLDIVEKDLLAVHLPFVTYLRLDGSIPATHRHAIVARFNADPSIDVLLLTTQVGGLGLNLTGADTVIFIEHDWNPMKDLQAMDRAHRIGQKKVVNVYRLITRSTVEEKIMGLQKFKLHTANTVITTANSSLSTMGTDQVSHPIVFNQFQ